jgi:hypothetical protein
VWLSLSLAWIAPVALNLGDTTFHQGHQISRRVLFCLGCANYCVAPFIVLAMEGPSDAEEQHSSSGVGR